MQRRSRLALSPVALALLASSAWGCFGITQDKSTGKNPDAGSYCLVAEAGADVSVDAADGALPDPATCSSYCPPPRPAVTTPVSTEAKNLLGQLTQDEKMQIMSGGSSCTRGLWNSDFNSTGVPRLDIPDWKMSDGPRGVHILSGGKSTTWAVAVARAAAFDIEMEQRVAMHQSEEMKALKYNVSLAPTINTLRHPLWARAQETYGEDPVLQGKMGAAFVRGMQENKTIVACPKHLVGNDTDDNRSNVIAHMDEQTLHENYLMPFQIVVDEGDPGMIMAAYNGVRGIKGSPWYQGGSQGWCTENEYVMTTVPRDLWHWNGVMMSDWWATKFHGDLSANGGLDLEMPDQCAFLSLPGLVPSKVPAARIDEAALRILNVRSKFSQLKVNHDPVSTSFLSDPVHIALSRETAEKGAVLLKNDNILPIGPAAAALGDGGSSSVRTIIFLGPDALQPTGEISPNKASGLGDRGSSGTNPPYAISFMGHNQPALGLVDGLKGKWEQFGPDYKVLAPSGNPDDAALADIAIIPVTMAHEDEGEAFDNGHDRIDLGLNANHPIHWGGFKPSAFIQQAATKNPRVIVLLAVGSAIVMEDWIGSAKGIVQTFYPGQEGGNAVAKLLTGEINFSGKLPFTVATDAGDYPIFDNKSSTTNVEYLHGYRRIEDAHKTPRFWFGFGKSYTTYEYSNLVIPCSNGITDQGQLTVQVTVKNTGAMAGTEIVQAYIGGYPKDADGNPRRPPKELKAFTRVTVAPGQSQVVELSVAAKDMAYWNQTAHQWVVQSGQHTVFVGPSADPAALLSATFTITPSTSGAP